MKELFRERELTTVNFYQNLLEAAGIHTFIKNENLSTTEGVSIPDFFPALCIVNDADLEKAASIIKEHLHESPAESTPDLVCGKCGESSPGNFETCWNCGEPLTR